MEAKLKVIIIFIAISLWLYFFYTPVANIFDSKIKAISICQKPITYSIGTFDNRFGLTKEEFLQDLDTATKIWEDSIGVDLFIHSSTDARLPVNLVYDERQSTTQKLKRLEGGIEINKSIIDNTTVSLKAGQDAFNAKKQEYENLVAEYKQELSQYNQDVANINKLGGASNQLLKIFENRKNKLEQKLSIIRQEEQALNQLNSELKNTSQELKTQVEEVNSIIGQYNQNTKTFPEEFNEGLYTKKGNQESIDIYQFDSKQRLIRLLVHEFGHALGIEHLDDKNAIMYRLNTKDNLSLSESDIEALKIVCQKKTDLFSQLLYKLI